jgi:uncharacterized membrane protein/uncharacterized BrkB/YihY/UPF0761 family membrane protein
MTTPTPDPPPGPTGPPDGTPGAVAAPRPPESPPLDPADVAEDVGGEVAEGGNGEHPEPPTGWRGLADRARRVGPAALAWAEDARPRFRAVDAAWELWDRDRQKAATLLAGALVYRLFVWLLPVSLLAVSVLGFVADTGNEAPEDLARHSGVGAYMIGVIASAADQARASRWFTLALALFGIAVAGGGTVRALRLSHALVWDTTLTKLKSAAVAVAVLLGLTILIGVLAAASWKARAIDPGLGVGSTLATAAVFAGVWLLASWLLPHADAPWWALVPGSVVGGAGVLGMHLFTVYYLAGKIESASQMYGSLGAAAAVLLWLSVFARLLIIGAGLNATLWRRRVERRARTRTRGAKAHEPLAPEARAATLTVWRFATPDGADAAERTLTNLAKEKLITIVDAATVSWPADRPRPRTHQVASPTGAGALSGSFWGLLFGVLFFVPVLGVAVGAAAGALAGTMTDIGIDDDFIAAVRREVTPGTSALFLLSSDARIEALRDAFAAHGPELVHTDLDAATEARLRDVFAD